MSFLDELNNAHAEMRANLEQAQNSVAEAYNQKKAQLLTQFKRYYGLSDAAEVNEGSMVVVSRLLEGIEDPETCKVNFCAAVDAAYARKH